MFFHIWVVYKTETLKKFSFWNGCDEMEDTPFLNIKKS